MSTDKQLTKEAETKETSKQVLLTRSTCPVCKSPSKGCVCHNCLDEMSEIDPGVVNRFLHTLASRDSRQEQKQRRPEWLLDMTETETDT